MYMSWLSDVYAMMLVYVHELVFMCVCHGAGKCICVGCQVCVCSGAGECTFVGCQVYIPWC